MKLLRKTKEELEQSKISEDLATQYSEDTASKEKSGDLGYFDTGKMVKEFEEAAYKLKKEEISELVKSQFVYHIIEVTDIKEQKPYDEGKDDIKKNLLKRKYKNLHL